MTLTTRPHGELLPLAGNAPPVPVTVVVWSEREEPAQWGGIVEAGEDAAVLRAQVAAGQSRYHLRLADGREGTIELRLSEFEADGAQPLAFAGRGELSRRGRSGS